MSFNYVHTYLHTKLITMNSKVSPFSDMLEAEDKTSDKNNGSSKNSTESTKISKETNCIEITETSKNYESMTTTSTTTSNEIEPVSTMLRRRCVIVWHRFRKVITIGRIKPILSECCMTDTSTVILCGEVTNENASSTICPCGVEVAMQYLTETKSNTFYC